MILQKVQTRSAKFLISLTAIAATAWAASAEAASVTLGRLTFSEVSGDFRITNGGFESIYYTIYQEVFGPNVNLYTSIDGFRDISRDAVGIRIQFIVKNLTGTPWIFYDHELQEVRGERSPEADGLSFAQGISSVRPFVSNRYNRIDEVTDSRDYVNFSDGIVPHGDVAVFRYAITDYSPINRFYLLQRPNFKPRDGFVTPPAPPQPPQNNPSPSNPTPPVNQPSSPPPTAPVPSPTAPVPPPTAAIPEPSTVLGLASASLGGLWLKRRQQKAARSS